MTDDLWTKSLTESCTTCNVCKRTEDKTPKAFLGNIDGPNMLVIDNIELEALGIKVRDYIKVFESVYPEITIVPLVRCRKTAHTEKYAKEACSVWNKNFSIGKRVIFFSSPSAFAFWEGIDTIVEPYTLIERNKMKYYILGHDLEQSKVEVDFFFEEV